MLIFHESCFSLAILQVPVLMPMDLMVEASPRRIFANAHTYHINSISVNSDYETYLSADDLRINLWHLEITDRSFSILLMINVIRLCVLFECFFIDQNIISFYHICTKYLVYLMFCCDTVKSEVIRSRTSPTNHLLQTSVSPPVNHLNLFTLWLKFSAISVAFLDPFALRHCRYKASQYGGADGGDNSGRVPPASV